ncbi:MAG: type II toxin-antitoxin system RelB/DinJ family antitoxin [Defluviitaleaceae bacterium]|nr:type II toxin-antitoxin system RelB/DinJ family antitoxin [Defluviitaleaceae bacterium]MCL2275914.1 type II toxin-antitoxin system RelB/DinJ family antitoxin [Defluviitaleaceae bacterium]
MEMVNISVNNDLVKKAEEICTALGLEVSSAVNMFLQQLINHEGIPFEVKVKKALDESIDTSADIMKGFPFECFKGRIEVPDDFCEPLEDLKEYMY